MEEVKSKEIIELLDELQNRCGDLRRKHLEKFHDAYLCELIKKHGIEKVKIENIKLVQEMCWKENKVFFKFTYEMDDE